MHTHLQPTRSLTRTIAPTSEPLTMAQVLAQCRIDSAPSVDETALLKTYIQAAREYCENQTQRAFIQQTWRLSLSGFPRHRYDSLHPWRAKAILLPRPKLIGIVGVQYYDATGTLQVLDPSLYVVDIDGEPGGVIPAPGTAWPATIIGRPDAVQITYTAGYGNSAAAVPAGIQLAMLGLVGHWYENRESVVLTSSPNSSTIVPQFVDDLLADESIMAFTYEVE